MLGRYKSDLNLLSRNDRDGLFQIDEHTGGIVFLEKPKMDIEFMTAHKSKGLQRDFVFLLCCSGGLKVGQRCNRRPVRRGSAAAGSGTDAACGGTTPILCGDDALQEETVFRGRQVTTVAVHIRAA